MMKGLLAAEVRVSVKVRTKTGLLGTVTRSLPAMPMDCEYDWSTVV